ncbi:FadR/GntR family transcriptional regulator [Consotaella aegiceratis]|uniref:FadR/GntR family transcriptional regulator n=1 Tax=Consotaella aegiceratis TaxID=3097961 RepID=UPI002F3F07E6
MSSLDNPAPTRPERLAVHVADMLRRDIISGGFPIGHRLPSEAALCAQHGVSRTVVREALATLRVEGLVEPRKGAGVFVKDAPPASPFTKLDTSKISSVIELLELRTAVEAEAAGLAAQRHSAAQEEAIVHAHRNVVACLADGKPTRDADFAFHAAIAEATNNPRFQEFLQLIRSGIIPRGELQGAAKGARPLDYNKTLEEEHHAILVAILDGQESEARNAMRSHLRGSLARYRELLRRG